MCVYFSQTATTVYRTVLAHPVALCEIDSIELKNTGARFYRQGDIHVKSVCLSEFPSYVQARVDTTCTHTHTYCAAQAHTPPPGRVEPSVHCTSFAGSGNQTASRPVSIELPHKSRYINIQAVDHKQSAVVCTADVQMQQKKCLRDSPPKTSCPPDKSKLNILL